MSREREEDNRRHQLLVWSIVACGVNGTVGCVGRWIDELNSFFLSLMVFIVFLHVQDYILVLFFNKDYCIGKLE